MPYLWSRVGIVQSVKLVATDGCLGFDSQMGIGLWFFIAKSGTTLGPTQHPVLWVIGPLSIG